MKDAAGWSRMGLNDIGLFYGTDKASIHHDYLSFYESFLASLREKRLTILEVGVCDAQSLQVWERYFPQAVIIGCDINPKSKQYETGRVCIEIVDQSNIEELTRVAVDYGPFDLIIEDGSHQCEHQLTTLRTLFPFVKANGMYIVEDLQTNYGEMLKHYRGVSPQTCVEFLKKWLDIKVADDQISLEGIEDPFLKTYGRIVKFFAFYRRACLIYKGSGSQSRASHQDNAINDPIRAEVNERVMIRAHVGVLGDMIGDRGFVNPIAYGRNYGLQGIIIESSSWCLEYKIRHADGVWSDWVAEGTFLGTKGRGLNLTGIAVRKSGRSSAVRHIRVFGRFQSQGIIEVEEGMECAPDILEALCGVRVAIIGDVHA